MYTEGHGGMNLRDYFAARSIAGMLASTFDGDNWGTPSEAAETAYVYADAMMEARKK
jgi:hypothetical protein